MIASQLIYTACGKDKSGAFSVWSKSQDVTKAECDEIIKLMSYKKPQNAPYEPTEEEIKTLFPKKYGYFVLTSGRKCIVQTHYVGKVYSDLDTRNGNFIIHAYIFTSLDGFNPFSLLGLNIFKTCLTYQEWHESAAPEELPQVEIPNNPIVNEQVIRSLLSGERKKDYISLLQAVINAAESDKTVTFNDTEENQILIYSLIGTLLPLKLFEKTTFTNQYTTQLDFAMVNSGMGTIKIRNIFSGMVNTTYNYSDEISKGNYAFNFLNNNCSKVDTQRYLSDIIQSLETENSLFGVLRKVDKINSIMLQTNCNVNTAIAIYNISQKNIAWFKDASEYNSTVDLAIKNGYIDESTLAQCLYKDIYLTEKWGKGSPILPITKFVYQYGTTEIKTEILYGYFNNLSSYGVNISDQPAKILARMKETVPFDWTDFVRETVTNVKWENYINGKVSANELYFVFDGLVSAIEKQFGEQENKRGYVLLIKILRKAVERRSYDDVQLFFGVLQRLNSSVSNTILEQALNGFYNSELPDESTFGFTLRVICSIADEKEKIKLLSSALLANIRTPFFMTVYLKFEEQNKNIFGVIESSNKNNPEFQRFLFKKEAYLFKITPNVSFKDLNSYFDKYYKNGYDNGVFIEKIKQYISLQKGRNKLIESLRIYSLIRILRDDFYDMTSILKCLIKNIYDLPEEELIGVLPQYIREVESLCTRLRMANIALPENYEYIKTVLVIKGKSEIYDCAKAIKTNTLYGFLNRTQLAKLFSEHFGEILNWYVDIRDKKITERNELLTAVFEQPLEIVNKNEIIEAIFKSKHCYKIMADIMAYAFNSKDRFANKLIGFVSDYNEKMKHGDNKKLFKNVVEYIPNTEISAVKFYIDKYSESHLSFFEKLFQKRK